MRRSPTTSGVLAIAFGGLFVVTLSACGILSNDLEVDSSSVGSLAPWVAACAPLAASGDLREGNTTPAHVSVTFERAQQIDLDVSAYRATGRTDADGDRYEWECKVTYDSEGRTATANLIAFKRVS